MRWFLWCIPSFYVCDQSYPFFHMTQVLSFHNEWTSMGFGLVFLVDIHAILIKQQPQILKWLKPSFCFPESQTEMLHKNTNEKDYSYSMQLALPILFTKKIFPSIMCVAFIGRLHDFSCQIFTSWFWQFSSVMPWSMRLLLIFSATVTLSAFY